MSKHDAEYFRQLRRATRDSVFASKFPQRATELRRLEQLPWPRNLLGELATIRELLAETAEPSGQAGQNIGDCVPVRMS
jgi:hypothetical protein